MKVQMLNDLKGIISHHTDLINSDYIYILINLDYLCQFDRTTNF